MQKKPKVVQLTLTYNRHSLLERVLRCFLEQDYEGDSTLFIYNTGEPTQLTDLQLPANKKVVLINNQKNLVTKEPYMSVGEKYRDALSLIPDDTDIINHLDDDDLAMPNHLSEGVKGILRNGKKGYKPKYSWFRHRQGITKAENVFEGSIFVTYEHLKSTGYLPVSVKYHDGWLLPLVAEGSIADPNGPSTWVYDWGGDYKAYKMSGRGQDTQENFLTSQVTSVDVGDGIIKPCPLPEVQRIFDKCVA